MSWAADSSDKSKGRQTSGKSLGCMIGVLGSTHLFRGTLGFAACGAFLSFFEPVAVAAEREYLRAVYEPVDQRHDASGVGEDLTPFAEGFVGRHYME